jgi:tripartite-type tricarboxylate transporter receptor subunit TctC
MTEAGRYSAPVETDAALVCGWFMPEENMRRLSILFAGLALALAGAVGAEAQTYPEKPVAIIVPYPPGGGIDGSARAFAEILSKKLGQPFVVENRAGAGGLIGVRAVATAKPDGHTLFYASPSSMTKVTVADFPIDVRTALAPVAGTYMNAFGVVVNGELPVKSLADLVAYAKANPGKLAYGAQTPSSTLMVELLKIHEGLDIKRIPYKGSAPAIVDLIGGRIHLMLDNYVTHLGEAGKGTVRFLALVSDQRRDVIPDVPTTAEAGYPYLSGNLVGGFFAPAGTDPEIIAAINAAVNEAAADPEVKKRVEGFGYTQFIGSPEELGKRVNAEIDYWTDTAGRIGYEAGQ